MRGSPSPQAIVLGAGPAGLACAAALRSKGLESVVLEKADHVGAAWRGHYDRLHLHTDRKHSELPGIPMPQSWPLYPSRLQVIEYLETYAARFGIRPVFGMEVTSLKREGMRWSAATASGAIAAPVAVVATGIARTPHRPSFPGIELYRGSLLHSSEYRNPSPYRGKRVLVVGFGNSGGEIALDLAEAGVDVALAVRGPVQILPRDLLGLPIVTWAIIYRHLPAGLVDIINAPVLRLALGSMEKLGLRRASKGPLRMIREDGRIPLIDVGTLGKIRDGSIKIRTGIDRLTADGVVFDDGRSENFDAVILATGFRPDLRSLLPDVEGLCRFRWAVPRRLPGCFSAARSPRLPGNCARSALRRSGLRISPAVICRAKARAENRWSIAFRVMAGAVPRLRGLNLADKANGVDSAIAPSSPAKAGTHNHRRSL